jgi:hypothetical protein
MDAQRIAIDAVVALTDCDREMVTTFIRRFYLAGVKDPKRLTFKGLQAIAQALKPFLQHSLRHSGARVSASPESISPRIVIARWIPGSPLRGAPE